MSKPTENITVTVELSPEDRELLRGIAKALGVPIDADASFVDTVGKFQTAVDSRPRRLIDGVRFQSAPPAEGDWQLYNNDREGEEIE